MTTKLIPISSITVAKQDRQRKDLGDLSGLMASFNRVGQINPITVTPDLILIAGERRFTAATNLGWDMIKATILDEIPTEKQRLIELEENVERSDLPWMDHCLAILDLHNLLSSQEPEWTMGKTAKYTGQATSTISTRIAVANEIINGDKFVCEAPRFSVALNYVYRKQERALAGNKDALEEMLSPSVAPKPAQLFIPLDEPELSLPDEPSPFIVPEAPIECANFHEFAKTYTGPKFNFLHCDFPYGINVEKHNGAGTSFEGYDDSRDVYFDLLETLQSFGQSHVADSAHLLFWYAFRYHQETVDALTSFGWKVHERPLIWHRSDNSGVLPDPKRGPRWVYETALMASRGDRPVVQAVSNLIPHPNTKELHKSEKPIPMLSHFFRMFVDSSTVMLDPTCGSGNSVIAAKRMGAKSVLGLELNPDFQQIAVQNYLKQMTLNVEL